MLHVHKYEEAYRYLIVTGEDQVFYRCRKCGKEKYNFTYDTLEGKANAPTYNEWYDNQIKLIRNGEKLT